MGRSTWRGWLLGALMLIGCEPAIDSAADAPADSPVETPASVSADSADDLPGDSLAAPFAVVESEVITSRVQVSPAVLSPGDTAGLLVMTHKSGTEMVSAHNGCAPGLGFQIRWPGDSIVDPYAGLAFICPRLDSQDLDPGETDSVTWKWAAPRLTGRYVVIGGLAVDGRLVGPSAPVTIEVR